MCAASANPCVSQDRPIIIGGAARSGTTLLSVMLNSHPELVCGPETDLFRLASETERLTVGPLRWAWHVARGWTEPFRSWSRDFGISLGRMRKMRRRAGSGAEFIELFFADYAARLGAVRWVDKTPANVKCLESVFRHFPNARFVHVIRDGRDVCCSVRDWSRRYHGESPLDIRAAAEIWSRWVRMGRAWSQHPHYREVRYEDLAAAPEDTLRALFRFLNLDWHPAVLVYHQRDPSNRPDLAMPHLTGAIRPAYTSSIGRWRSDLTIEDRRVVEEEAGATLRELGYTHSNARVEGNREATVHV